MTVLPKGEFTSERGNINATGQGNIIEQGFGFDLKINDAIKSSFPMFRALYKLERKREEERSTPVANTI